MKSKVKCACCCAPLPCERPACVLAAQIWIRHAKRQAEENVVIRPDGRKEITIDGKTYIEGGGLTFPEGFTYELPDID